MAVGPSVRPTAAWHCNLDGTYTVTLTLETSRQIRRSADRERLGSLLSSHAEVGPMGMAAVGGRKLELVHQRARC